MDQNTVTRGEFLSNLLRFQPDGDQTISQPSNWLDEPLIHIKTWLDKYVDVIVDGVRPPDDDSDVKKGVWVFLIGSPGGGKSSLCGQVARELNKNDFEFRDSNRDELVLENLEDLPYIIEIKSKQHKFATGRFIQDASSVKNLYSDGDPVKDLIEEIDAAYKSGVSLIVCNNRGIIEQVIDRCTGDPAYSDWLDRLKEAYQAERIETEDTIRFNSNNKGVFDEATLHCVSLDRKSMFDEEDEESPERYANSAKNIFEKLTEESNWAPCGKCEASSVCPFKANRDWLHDEARLNSFLKILKRVETYSSQAVVFREMLSLASLLFTGCVRDYKENQHPCDWVREKHASENLFPLIARRIYMLLFGAHTPTGLDENQNVAELQRAAFQKLPELLDEADEPEQTAQTLKAWECLANKTLPISTDVGVRRMLGPKGLLTTLGPAFSRIPVDLSDKWKEELDENITSQSGFSCELESSLWEIMKDTEAIQVRNQQQAPEETLVLQRWRDNIEMRIATLLNGYSKFSDFLDDFSNKVKALNTERGLVGKKKSEFLNKLKGLLVEGGEEVVLSKHLSMKIDSNGSTLELKLPPKQRGFLKMEFKVDKQSFYLNAQQYLWLKLRHEGLSENSLPDEMRDALSQNRQRILAAKNFGTEKQVKLVVYGSEPQPLGTIVVDGTDSPDETYVDDC